MFDYLYILMIISCKITKNIKQTSFSPPMLQYLPFLVTYYIFKATNTS